MAKKQYPDNWEVKRWKDVLEIRSGRNQKGVENSNGKYPILGSAGKVMGFADEYICEEDTTIIGRKGTINNPMFIESKFWNVDTAFGLHACDGLNKRYLYYFCRSYDFTKQDKGSGRPSLVKTNLQLIEIPLPPLGEQERIVAILDEAFAAIATATANAEKNLAHARELFESELNRVFSQRGDGWVERPIKEITSLLGDGLHGTPKYTVDGEYHFINGNNLDDGQIVFKESTKRVSVTEYEKYKKTLTDRTVLVSINGTLGKVAFYNNEKVVLGKSACYFNLIDGVNKYFIKYIISSPCFLQYAHREATGATIKNVSLRSMRKFGVPLPSLNEQDTIVSKFDKLSAETQRLESIYQQKLAALAELKQSILHKAFTGELTAGAAEPLE